PPSREQKGTRVLPHILEEHPAPREIIDPRRLPEKALPRLPDHRTSTTTITARIERLGIRQAGKRLAPANLTEGRHDRHRCLRLGERLCGPPALEQDNSHHRAGMDLEPCLRAEQRNRAPRLLLRRLELAAMPENVGQIRARRALHPPAPQRREYLG